MQNFTFSTYPHKPEILKKVINNFKTNFFNFRGKLSTIVDNLCGNVDNLATFPQFQPQNFKFSY